MAPSNPIECSKDGCAYSTPANTPTFELMLKALELHSFVCHPSANPNPIAAQQKPFTKLKLGCLPRPTFSLST